VFGSTIGLMFFFNIVAQVFLMVGAWIATDVHTPGGTAPSDDEVAAAQEADLGIAAGGRIVTTNGGIARVAGTAEAVHPEHEARVATALGVGLITGWLVGRRSARGDRRRDI
jgi:hypothetical protein